MSKPGRSNHSSLDLPDSGLPKTTNWIGPFVIGLAGTILVTGIAPVIDSSMGSAGVVWMVFWTITGLLLCLVLAELATMMPNRTGGAPAYVYAGFKERWPRLATHVNGFCSWAYWHGWFPVAPLNMILASFYIVQLFNLPTNGFTVLGTQIAWWTVGISIGGILLLFIPAYLGMRFSQGFAVALAILSMIPMTFLAISWIFHPSIGHYHDLFSFAYPDGQGFFSSQFGANWFEYGMAWSFLITWNVIAMEAAACYLGETRNPGRDAKISMSLEGGYGVFIYTMIPAAFIIAIGLKAIGDPALTDPKTIFITLAAKVFGTSTASTVLEWLIAWMLILALILSALNAITGCGRSLHQAAADGHLPHWFGKLNKHGVPHNSMLFNVACSLIIVFLGGAVQIYTYSNVGYLATFIPVFIAYFILRKDHPEWPRPFRLPGWMTYGSLVLAAIYAVCYFYGGPVWALSTFTLAHQNTMVYYVLGLITLVTYAPLYWWRRWTDKKALTTEATASLAATSAASFAAHEIHPNGSNGSQPNGDGPPHLDGAALEMRLDELEP
jgi:amino acid transporter